MRVPNSSSVRYSPNVAPSDPEAFRRFVSDELAAIQAAIQALAAGHLDMTTVATTKPRNGDIRYAAGAPHWDPGSGRGVYYFDGTIWKLLG